MSESLPMTIGLVTEGPTDHTVLEEVLASQAWDGEEFRFLPIQPESSDAFGGFGHHGSGWKGVRRWCQEAYAMPGGLSGYLSGAYGGPVDVLVIHVDADIAGDHEIGVEQPCPPASATTDEIRKVVLGWLDSPAMPPKLVLAIPSKSIEAWVLAALAAKHNKAVAGIECIANPALRLARKPLKFLRTKDGQPKRDQDVYSDILGPETAARWDKVCAVCTEAKRFTEEFAAALTAASDAA
jgi:hypothetical protein